MQNNNNKNEKKKKSCTLPPSLQWAGERIPANMYKGRLIGKPPTSLLMAGRQATGPHYSIKTNIFWKSKKNKKRPLNRHLISPLLLYKARCSLQNARGTAWPIKKTSQKIHRFGRAELCLKFSLSRRRLHTEFCRPQVTKISWSEIDFCPQKRVGPPLQLRWMGM